MGLLEWINSNVWIISIITLIAGATFTKRRELYIKLAEEKSKHYSRYFDILYAPELNTRLYLYQKTNIILYGSNEVIKKLSICEKNGINTNDIDSQKDLSELVYAMKKDIERPRLTLDYCIKNVPPLQFFLPLFA